MEQSLMNFHLRMILPDSIRFLPPATLGKLLQSRISFKNTEARTHFFPGKRIAAW